MDDAGGELCGGPGEVTCGGAEAAAEGACGGLAGEEKTGTIGRWIKADDIVVGGGGEGVDLHKEAGVDDVGGREVTAGVEGAGAEDEFFAGDGVIRVEERAVFDEEAAGAAEADPMRRDVSKIAIGIIEGFVPEVGWGRSVAAGAGAGEVEHVSR